MGVRVTVGKGSGVGTSVDWGVGMAVDDGPEVGEGVAVGNGVAVGTMTAVGINVEVGVDVVVGTNTAIGAGVGGTVGSSVGGVAVIVDSTLETTGEGRTPSCPAHAIRKIPAAKIVHPPIRAKRTGPPLR